MTPVEKVARALAYSDHGILERNPDVAWNYLTERKRARYLEHARAALSALEEPSEAMCVAGARAAWLTDEETDKTLAYCIYRAAIRAALEEKP